jgi:hypothetical protein
MKNYFWYKLIKSNKKNSNHKFNSIYFQFNINEGEKISAKIFIIQIFSKYFCNTFYKKKNIRRKIKPNITKILSNLILNFSFMKYSSNNDFKYI